MIETKKVEYPRRQNTELHELMHANALILKDLQHVQESIKNNFGSEVGLILRIIGELEKQAQVRKGLDGVKD